MLPKLIASNDESSVVNVTTDAFTKFFANCDLVQDGLDLYLTALKEPLDELCKLKGVGPATATLVLSLMYKVPKYAKYAPPFFSDEMYAYFLGTDEKMKYSLKEYRALITEVFPIYATFPMGIIEKGSWTLEVVRTMKIKGKLAMKLKGAFPVEVSDGMYWQSVKGKKRLVKGEEENRATKKRRL
ncbi:hypothetical protein BABINDRAFT_160818 [Babjeviella inositovora NRRL Y-12698]|uniref:HhH-GPD domain-containing protein n=1 Tax=Babjeviella inositovora NRRL Y-12698 TaxID=984486 RepID=A0A1E3QS91_9ASCO|nr:uncharacterized protein BABINDRAFT_160818 [Babjeviella inositovora NRRL Y-12698]ODQ80551.1 hypothetical protein BABINDRAFT_160818 [Babjeviella inositovora NRRL Y-12698]